MLNFCILDIVSGLAVLFIAGFAIGGSVLALVVLDVDAEDRRYNFIYYFNTLILM